MQSMQSNQQLINLIPYSQFIRIMNSRKYNIKRIHEYTLDIYSTDITTIPNFSLNIENNEWNQTIYDSHLLADLKLQQDDKSRMYFNTYIKPRYVKFINQYFFPKHTEKLDDLLIPKQTKANVIHHIHPLIFGGNNFFYNLLPVTEFNHKMLHLNPHENNRRASFKAVDYLSYLYLPETIKTLRKKYFTKKITDQGFRFVNLFWKIIFEEEMQKLYQTISTQ